MSFPRATTHARPRPAVLYLTICLPPVEAAAAAAASLILPHLLCSQAKQKQKI